MANGKLEGIMSNINVYMNCLTDMLHVIMDGVTVAIRFRLVSPLVTCIF